MPAPVPESPHEEDKSPRTLPLSHHISWSHLLRRTFSIDTICPRCKSPLRLIALIETEDTIKKGHVHTCGITTDGAVSCWGGNSDGQSRAPSGTFKSVSAGSDFTCAVRADSTVVCWGYDYYGEASPPS